MTEGLLALMRLVSPALPVGAFSYSRGLEQAVELGWVHDVDSARRWILGVLEHSYAPTDGAAFLRLYGAFSEGDVSTAESWGRMLWACRETSEMRLEDQQMGGALARLLRDLEQPAAEAWIRHPHVSFAAMFALAAVHWKVASSEALLGLLWAQVESQVSAALRLIPLGQTDGQRIVSASGECIARSASAATALSDDEVGNVAFGQAIASSLHETQYSRLFRS